MMRESVTGTLAATGVEPAEIDTAHVGNFAGGLYSMQGHLGAFITDLDPAFRGLPTGRHEAACASGSIALLAASAEIEAGRYHCSLVVGVEQMKSVGPAVGGDYLGTAAWYEKEAKGIEFPFPKLFGRLGDEYDKRYGLRDEHLAAISALNYANAKLNPRAQTRTWYMNEAHANCRTEDNPAVGGRIRIADCSQVTDGAASVILASESFAKVWAERQGKKLEDVPKILGWGHATAPILLSDKFEESKDDPYVLPHVRRTVQDAFRRAGIADVSGVDGIETHDCFTTSEYMAIDHFGITAPGESWKAIEEGWLAIDSKHPINPSGGLIGAGHPVGATGVRQLLDSYRQVTGTAGDYQVDGAKRFATLNIGGSGTTSVSFVVGT
jgi:acetyl-CoA C-acetyltransferase